MYDPLHRRRPAAWAAAVLLLFAGRSGAAPHSIRELQSRISQTEEEMLSLPELLLNPSPWTLGYRSDWIKSQEETETIDLRFKSAEEIDLIALLPATYSPSSTEVKPFGFPLRFTIERLLEGESAGIIVDQRHESYAVSGIEPQLFPLAAPVTADGIRITILHHAPNPTWWRTKYITALSEIMVFSKTWNAALGAEVDVSSERPYGYVWTRRCLADGFSLFSPVSGELENPRDNFYWSRKELILQFDLGEKHEIDELRLWPVAHSRQHNFPQSSGIEFPTQIRLELLDAPDAETGRLIYTDDEHPMRPGSSPLMLRLPRTTGRWFRLRLSEPLPEFRAVEHPELALSEIEIAAKGRVLTRGRLPAISGPSADHASPILLKRLTDGHTSEGEILPLRSWIEGLNRRARLERLLNRMKQDLAFARRQERERLFFMILLLGCLTPVLAWLAKLLADRRWKRTRDRIACDLHDEIGTNVSSLAHMTELIKETIPAPTDFQAQILDNAVCTARMTSGETRSFIQLLETDKSGFSIRSQIEKTALQTLAGMDYRLQIAPDAGLARLTSSKQWDLFLFVKEALNNIIKHAEASAVEISICRRGGCICLTITDNGRGIPETEIPPRHLHIRAERLHAALQVENQAPQGTHIQLNFK